MDGGERVSLGVKRGSGGRAFNRARRERARTGGVPLHARRRWWRSRRPRLARGVRREKPGMIPGAGALPDELPPLLRKCAILE